MDESTKPQALKLIQLFESAVNGKLVLPEFQRKFVWKPRDVELLLSSVAQGWPIGSFMIWKPDEEFRIASRDFDGVGPREEDNAAFLLDGQQRLTALLHALNPDYSKYRYFIKDFVSFLTADVTPDLEDHLQFLSAKVFHRRYPDLTTRVKKDVALISDVVQEQAFSSWTGLWGAHRSEEAASIEFFSRRRAVLPGLKYEYEVPCVMLGSEQKLESVARIFETTNKTGIKLGIVDLMVAKLYPSGFKLRDEWHDVQQEQQSLGAFFGTPESEGEVNAEDVLRILAYWTSGGAGVTRTQILKMKPEQVGARWSDAVAALVRALEFLRDKCGVVQGSLVPARMMLVPIAVGLDSAEKAGIDCGEVLERWFWSAVATSEFSRSTNSRAVRQTKKVAGAVTDAENGNGSEGPFWDGQLKRDDVVGALREKLLDSARGEQPLERAVLSLVVARGGRDWLDQKRPLVEVAGTIEAHHVVPKRAVGVQPSWNVDCIANLTPQGSVSNKALKNDFPLKAGVKGAATGPHFCDFAEFGATEVGGFEEFVQRRADKLADEVFWRAGGAAEEQE